MWQFLAFKLKTVGAVTALYSKRRECFAVILCRDLSSNLCGTLWTSVSASWFSPVSFHLPLLVYSCLSLSSAKSPDKSVCMTNWAEASWYSPCDDPWACQLSGLEQASTIHPIPSSWSISWLISNLLRKWVSAFLLPGIGWGPAYLAAYTEKSLILLDLECGREVLMP